MRPLAFEPHPAQELTVIEENVCAAVHVFVLFRIAFGFWYKLIPPAPAANAVAGMKLKIARIQRFI